MVVDNFYSNYITHKFLCMSTFLNTDLVIRDIRTLAIKREFTLPVRLLKVCDFACDQFYCYAGQNHKTKRIVVGYCRNIENEKEIFQDTSWRFNDITTDGNQLMGLTETWDQVLFIE